MAGRPGVTENISFEIDTWRNGDTEQGVNISGIHNGNDQDQYAFTNGVILNDGQRVSGKMEISWNPQSGASFKTTGLVTNANFNNIEIPNFEPSDDHTFIISARVGGANQDLFIDNISVTTESSPINPDPIQMIQSIQTQFVMENYSSVNSVQETTPFLRMKIRKPQTGLRSTMAKKPL